MTERYPILRAFARGYLHEDLEAKQGTPWAALEAFLAAAKRRSAGPSPARRPGSTGGSPDGRSRGCATCSGTSSAVRGGRPGRASAGTARRGDQPFTARLRAGASAAGVTRPRVTYSVPMKAASDRSASPTPARAASGSIAPHEAVGGAVPLREPGLEVDGFYLEPPLGAVRLWIEPAHELTVVEDRQRVVAVDPLVARRVDLQRVVEAEQPARAVPVPEERVEGRQQGGARAGRRFGLRRRGRASPRRGRSGGRARPRPDLDDLARLEGAAQDLSPLGGREAREGEVHSQVGLAGRPHGMQRLPQVPPPEPAGVKGSRATARAAPARHRSKRFWNPTANARACARSSRGSRAHERGLPVPPPRPGPRAPLLEVVEAQRSALRDRVLHRPQHPPVRLQPAPQPRCARSSRASPAARRASSRRDEARGVRPVLEQHPSSIGDPLHGRAS